MFTALRFTKSHKEDRDFQTQPCPHLQYQSSAQTETIVGLNEIRLSKHNPETKGIFLHFILYIWNNFQSLIESSSKQQTGDVSCSNPTDWKVNYQTHLSFIHSSLFTKQLLCTKLSEIGKKSPMFLSLQYSWKKD